MEEVKEEKYNDFFTNVENFMRQAEIHKRRGNNDFNPYLKMWSERNEVKLHSALLCGFLDPHNNHYQGDVFLETFLETIDSDLKKWFGETAHADVYSEDNYIDIYITNGLRHIIVENKIRAGDQKEQIQRYIETIAKDENVLYEDIAVLYLAPQPNKNNKRMPSQDSLGKWTIQGDYLEREGDKVRFRAISYDKEILQWIELAKQKVGCITNLNAALSFYKDVVQIITNTKENTMSLAKFLTKDKDNMKYQLEIVWDIFDMKEEIYKEYSKAIMKKYSDEIEAKGFEIIEGIEDTWDNDKKVWKYPYVIKPKDCKKHYLAFCIEYYPSGNKYCTYGVRFFWGHLESSKHKNNEKIPEYLDKMIYGWWYSRNDESMRGAETALEKFLNDAKIKELNDKLKNYKAE